ncbi:ROK family protein, partial [Streptomyces virginiae]
MQIFGVDIGGSGIKGAPVDLERGDLAQERHKVLTPQPGAPARGGGGVGGGVRPGVWEGPGGVSDTGGVAG